jgi:ABC-type transport system involved in multi-copper enzyme maturation permease subunit
MLLTLIRKEIVETMLDLRFLVASLLCVVLIPLGMYVSQEDYHQRLAAYEKTHDVYRQRHGTPKPPVTGKEEAQGLRPPTALSIFASGIEPFLPDNVITSCDGLYRTTKEARACNPQSLLFGKADLLFNVTFIVSLMALIFTFNAVSGERERGTLRLMIAHSVSRSRILLSKVLGRYVALLTPFLLAILISLFVLDLSPDVSIVSSQVWPAFLLILLATLLFLLGMVCLGVCVSTFTRSSKGSIVLLFFVWVVFLFAVPRISPILAEMLCPVESASVVDFTKRMIHDNIERELQQREKETIDSKLDAELDLVWQQAQKMEQEMVARVRSSGREPVRDDYKEINKFINERDRKLKGRYAPDRERLVKESQICIAKELRKIEEGYRNKKTAQFSLAMDFARLSPISCYSYFVSGLCGTGVEEPDNFVRNAQKFQEQVEQIFYQRVPWALGRQLGYMNGFDPFKPPTFPDLAYHYPSPQEGMRSHWPDLVLLVLYDLLFFSFAFMRFNRYDVR